MEINPPILIRQVLERGTCDRLVELIAASPEWRRSPTLGGSDYDLRNQWQIDRGGMTEELLTLINPVETWVTREGPEFGFDFPDLKPDVCQFQRTQPGGYFHWHRDAFEEHPRRLISLTYLSDTLSHDLVGGATEFGSETEGGISPFLRLEPMRGISVWFPPHVLHRGCAVQRGTKYVLGLSWE